MLMSPLAATAQDRRLLKLNRLGILHDNAVAYLAFAKLPSITMTCM